MTNITKELARLNRLAERGTIYDEEYGPTISIEFCKAAPDAVALLNTMHGLLVQAEGALAIYANPDLFDGSYYPGAHAEALKTLTALRDAGIGGHQ